MAFGSGKYTYDVQSDWAKLPNDWKFGWIPAIAVDSQDRVFVYSRSEHPLVIFDTGGNFLEEWGYDVLKDAHGIFIDKDDNVYCVERNTHCVHKFDKTGKLLMTLGTPDKAGAEGEPFNLPTDLGIDSQGNLYISDGYGNARVHKYSPEGERIKSWGKPGSGPGEFNLPHCVRVDRNDRLLVADRGNNRIQLFDIGGNYLGEWTGFTHPDMIHIDTDDTVYVSELDQRVTILNLDGEVLAQWGGNVKSSKPGEFLACPHGIWTDSRGDLYVGEVQADNRLQKFIRK